MTDEPQNFDELLTPMPTTPSNNALSLPATMSFPDAMKKVLDGRKIRRESWSGDDYCLLKDGWITIYTNGDFHVWKINDGDMEGQDWVLVKDAS
jgi:hypothetical protein